MSYRLANPAGRLLVVFNLLLKLDDHKATPLLAHDYTF